MLFCLGDSVGFMATGGELYEFFLNGMSVQGPDVNNLFSSFALMDGDVVSVVVEEC